MAAVPPTDPPNATMEHGERPHYFHHLEDPSRFVNIDEPQNYATYMSRLISLDTRNFVVDFGNDDAWAALDITSDELMVLLKHKRPAALYTRWINLWAPNLQEDVVKILSDHYGFSPRLSGLMSAKPLTPQPTTSDVLVREHRRGRDRTRVELTPTDEENIELDKVPSTKDKELDANHYSIVDEVWHYYSMDYGDKFMCLGYNWLHNVPPGQSLNAESNIEESADVPSGKRLWTWLILCDDGTVISVHEDPYPNRQSVPANVRENLKIIRRNLLNVFRQLSKAGVSASPPNAISTLHIRKGLASMADPDAGLSNSSPGDDTPSLLFYYLFDDWYTTYSLVVRRQHRYGQELRLLRQELLDRPGLDQLNKLHQVGRQLAVLKRVYKSYKMIIDRILERQKPRNKLGKTHLTGREAHPGFTEEPEEQHHSPLTSARGRSTSSLSAAMYGSMSLDGVIGTVLSPTAIVRFQRLGDRIDLYVLSEIQECLDEKEALVFMVFNLIAIKESQAVERLTRTTILFAKLTILFLPVSLMTAYFSMQMDDIAGRYTSKTYWKCFGVIIGISLSLLVAFGFITGTVEGKVIYKGLFKSFLGVSGNMVGQFRRKRKQK